MGVMTPGSSATPSRSWPTWAKMHTDWAPAAQSLFKGERRACTSTRRPSGLAHRPLRVAAQTHLASASTWMASLTPIASAILVSVANVGFERLSFSSLESLDLSIPVRLATSPRLSPRASRTRLRSTMALWSVMSSDFLPVARRISRPFTCWVARFYLSGVLRLEGRYGNYDVFLGEVLDVAAFAVIPEDRERPAAGSAEVSPCSTPPVVACTPR